MWYILDENNETSPADTLGQLVAYNEMPDGSLLSTVFICLDHSLGRSDGPVLFESKWFGGPHDGHQRQYKTLDEAKEGHADMLERYNAESVVAK